MNKKGLSDYKFKKYAKESLKNSLRLHSDSILLFEHESYPSSFQLSVLALEEFAKAKWIDHYYYSSVTNTGFPDIDFEQKWLKYLFLHPKKQYAFIAQELFDYSPKFVKFIKDRKLELKKQQSIYVGLEKSKNTVDTTSKISIPANRITARDARQIISLVNHEFLEIFFLIERNKSYWGIWELDTVINENDYQLLFCWPYKSGLKSKRWNNAHQKNSS